ncbi:NADPH:quinone oxidoreductase family protein [Streptomyces albireticuli]|uniref:Alcohol dehydrogenase n=1 Tax=Streptomyces albireticuli TaxID=1940 RepID=A0A2A2D3T1_9ACTN|nr:NADPH:quinone oxidoreductase family protein [Streptomyces albireticuli]MCD9141206.1 NADPH:quinone oxidoreductase family protein [Streptomyces albireticuli]MCD9160833.1 NADPH:quinone oxidoreductase family protein [Streptomyces albireticuli]MCD9191110.1 NADPH:quinone oxidoreductase family protein [Streptomyces albireticuli]PAU47103.1 alcohol dehydrogenase [Streptomyces albireticuli]
MKAWRVHRTGEPRTVMRLEDAPEPVPGPGQLLVRVRAANVNFPDALLCRGRYQISPPLPFTPGVELCAEVLAGGEGVKAAVGARILARPALPAGGFAERTVVDARSALPVPGSLDDAEAAALHIGYQTGWFGLHRRARLRAGETLLVHAAAGGVGSAAVQLGKAAGATVIGVAGGPEKARTARELGCDLVLDRHADDVVAAVKEATGGRGADVVYDPVGGDAFVWSTKCVAFEGRIVVVGFASGTVPQAALNHALVKNYTILGLHWGLYQTKDPAAVRACHDELTHLADRGAVRPLVSERVPLEAAADAVQRVADGTTTGRIVVVPAEEAP